MRFDVFTNHKYQGLNSITFNICFIKGSLVSSDKKPFALRYIKNSDFNFINTLLEHHILPIYNKLKEVLPKKERKNIYHFQDAVSHSTLFKQICLLKNTASKLVARPIVHDNTFSSIKHYHNAMGIEKKNKEIKSSNIFEESLNSFIRNAWNLDPTYELKWNYKGLLNSSYYHKYINKHGSNNILIISEHINNLSSLENYITKHANSYKKPKSPKPASKFDKPSE